jgi:hypothetical protein
MGIAIDRKPLEAARVPTQGPTAGTASTRPVTGACNMPASLPISEAFTLKERRRDARSEAFMFKEHRRDTRPYG